MWKRGEIAPAISPLFHIILYIFLTSGVKLHIHLLDVVVQFIVFLTLSTLICWGTDISKCFSESLGIRGNESRLYKTTSVKSAHPSDPVKVQSTLIISNSKDQSFWFEIWVVWDKRSARNIAKQKNITLYLLLSLRLSSAYGWSGGFSPGTPVFAHLRWTISSI